jgi:ubiquinone/menaquinone biosynthesis C-methylase UbiE
MVGGTGRVIALDVQLAALKRVSRAAARRGLQQLRVISSKECGSLPDNSVDLALLYDVLHIDPTQETVTDILSTIGRLLKPRGILSVGDHHLDETSLVQTVVADGFFAFAERTGQTCQFRKHQHEGTT